MTRMLSAKDLETTPVTKALFDGSFQCESEPKVLLVSNAFAF